MSRWEKIYKRLNLLDKNYPIKNPKCDSVEFMRHFEGDPSIEQTLYTVIKKSIIKQKLVFIGGYACSLYDKYMTTGSKEKTVKINNIPDFDALSENPKESAIHIKNDLEKAGFSNIKIVEKPGIGEIIAPHYEIIVDKDTICFIYEPLGCHSYNTITIDNKEVKIASIDTMLNLLLAFLYADRPYYDHDRIICMCEYLFKVQIKNKLKQKGLLKRFGKDCYGTETTIESLRETKTKKYKELKNNRKSKEYQEYFMKYDPTITKIKNTKKINYKPEIKKNKTIKKGIINKIIKIFQ